MAIGRANLGKEMAPSNMRGMKKGAGCAYKKGGSVKSKKSDNDADDYKRGGRVKAKKKGKK